MFPRLSLCGFALLRNSRKTECGAGQLLARWMVRAAPFALLTGLAATVHGAQIQGILMDQMCSSKAEVHIVAGPRLEGPAAVGGARLAERPRARRYWHWPPRSAQCCGPQRRQ